MSTSAVGSKVHGWEGVVVGGRHASVRVIAIPQIRGAHPSREWCNLPRLVWSISGKSMSEPTEEWINSEKNGKVHNAHLDNGD